MQLRTMNNDPLPRIIGFIGIAISTILALGLTDINWFVAVMLAFLASLALVANTQGRGR